MKIFLNLGHLDVSFWSNKWQSIIVSILGKKGLNLDLEKSNLGAKIISGKVKNFWEVKERSSSKKGLKIGPEYALESESVNSVNSHVEVCIYQHA